MTLDISALDHVIQQTVEVVEQSKKQIFDIAEQAREECEHLTKEIQKLKREVAETIHEGDRLEYEANKARKDLAQVSRNFETYAEADIKEAYERANEVQSRLTLKREEEKHLRTRRDDLQFRLRKLGDTIEKAENLMTQMNVVADYMSGDLQKVGQAIEDAKQQHRLGLEIIKAQEEERRRVAREIHDGPAQQMANVALRSELVERVFVQQGGTEALEELRSLKKLVRGCLGEVRRIIFNLRPMALDDLGLIPTLTRYIEVMQETNDVDIEFTALGSEDERFSSTLEVALFRFAQESITNVIKHANATQIKVKVEINPEFIYLVIVDDGKGFDVEEKKNAGFGLLGMRERAKLLNGDMHIDSNPGEGTKILFKIAIEQEGEETE